MRGQTQNPARRRRVAIPAVVAGAASSLLLAFSFTPTFSAFTAAINNNTNTANTGVLVMTESDGTNTCTSSGNTVDANNTATCAIINKYGGTSGTNQTTASAPLVPKAGANSYTTTVTVKNSGTIPASTFSLTPGACSQSLVGSSSGTATDLCSQMTVKIEVGSGTSPATWAPAFAAGSLTALNTGGAIDVLGKLGGTPLAPNGVVSFRFTVTLPTTLDNTYQGLQAKQGLTFSFQA